MADDKISELVDEMPAVLGDLIGAVGRGVADAQHALDRSALDHFRAIAEADDELAETLRSIGYQPTWYKIPELTADITLSLTIAGRSESSGRSTGVQLYATPIDANYANKYFVNAEVTSNISFKVVAVPPSPQAAELVVVPDLVGLTYAAAVELLSAVGLKHTRHVEAIMQLDSDQGAVGAPADSDPVWKTVPERQELMMRGDAVVVSTRKHQDEGAM